MKEKTVAGIEYSLPQVYLLQESGLGTSEFAARTAYNSFSNSENTAIKELNKTVNTNYADVDKARINAIKPVLNNIEHSDLLDDLAWTYFHHSILEHCNLTYLIKGISRGVLQEHSRHRIQAITVQSTRYTMSSVINAFVASRQSYQSIQFFALKIKALNMFVITDNTYLNIEIETIFNKLMYQRRVLGNEEFDKLAVAKSSLPFVSHKFTSQELYDALECGKAKRNVGDAFKHIVTDNWKVDMVITFNLRSLRNYFELRDSGAAFWQIRELAKAMKEATPVKYLGLIDKNYKDKLN